MRKAILLSVLVATSCAGTSSSQPGPRPTYVASASWSHTAEGYRLHVRPNALGRFHAATNSQVALDQSLHDAGAQPLRLTPAMRDSLVNQLRCHAVFAPSKPLWNLETWRPDVGYARTVLAACNP